MVGEPTQRVERALILDPNNLKALALAGSAAFENKDFAKAIAFWSKAQGLAPPGSGFAEGLASSIEEARAAAGQPGLAQTTAKSAPTPTALAAGIQADHTLNTHTHRTGCGYSRCDQLVACIEK